MLIFPPNGKRDAWLTTDKADGQIKKDGFPDFPQTVLPIACLLQVRDLDAFKKFNK